MKKIFFLLGAFTILTMTAFVRIGLHTDVFAVDTSKSTLEWHAQKVTGKHKGIINISNGQIKNDHGTITGTFEINMKSIQNIDLDPGKGKEKLENHLKSADFFDVEKYPVSKFIITSVIPLKTKSDNGNTHTVKGLLTIKDKTNEIAFNAAINMETNSVTCIGSAIVDRSKFDIKYGSKTFFPDIGDKMIYDEFSLIFNVVAVK